MIYGPTLGTPLNRPHVRVAPARATSATTRHLKLRLDLHSTLVEQLAIGNNDHPTTVASRSNPQQHIRQVEARRRLHVRDLLIHLRVFREVHGPKDARHRCPQHDDHNIPREQQGNGSKLQNESPDDVCERCEACYGSRGCGENLE
jgi:hypothetical protein